MKTVVLPIVITLGVVLVLGVASYFPFYFMYDFAGEDFTTRIKQHPYSVDHDMYRTRLTLTSLVIAGVIVALMFLLRKGCKALGLVIYEKMLLLRMFFVGIATLLLTGGMWLDFVERHYAPPHYYFRIGFIFPVFTI